jgi:hypothetical protein
MTCPKKRGIRRYTIAITSIFYVQDEREVDDAMGWLAEAVEILTEQKVVASNADRPFLGPPRPFKSTWTVQIGAQTQSEPHSTTGFIHTGPVKETRFGARRPCKREKNHVRESGRSVPLQRVQVKIEHWGLDRKSRLPGEIVLSPRSRRELHQ